MGPVQYVFLAIGLTIALVGLARGYDKELGNSIILMITVAVIGFIADRYQQRIASLAGSLLGVQNINVFLYLLYSITFVIVVFSSYSGVTLVYGGKPVSGLVGRLISFGVGLFNGYLIAGSLWYFAHAFNYPLGGVQQPLNPAASAWIGLLPQTIFPDPLYWILPAAVLLILRVRG